MSILKRMLTLVTVISLSVAAYAQNQVETYTVKQDSKGKWGIMNSEGKWEVKAEYTAIESMGDGYYLVTKDGKQGVFLMDKYGDEKVFDCKYSSIYKYKEEDAGVKFIAQEKDKPEKWVVASYERRAGSYLGKWEKKGLKDASVKEITDGVTLVAGVLDNGYGVSEDIRYVPTGILIKDALCIPGVIRAKQFRGNIFVCSKVDALSNYVDDGAVYDMSTGEYLGSDNMLRQLASTDALFAQGRISESDYKTYEQFWDQLRNSDTIIAVGPFGNNDNYWGPGTKVIMPGGLVCEVQDAGASLRYLITNDGKKGIYDCSDEKLIFSPDYDAIVSGGVGDFYFLNKDGMWGIYSISNNVNTGLVYPGKECPFKVENHKGPIMVTSKGKVGLLDIQGNELIKCEYDNISVGPTPDVLVLEKNGGVGMYNALEKKIIIPTGKYASIERITGSNNYYRVEQNGKYGVVNNKGVLVVACKYNRIENAFITDGGFIDDGFHVWDANDRVGIVRVINGQGKEILPCGSGYEIVCYEPYGIMVRKNGKLGCIKLNGAIFAQPKYDGYVNGMKRMAFLNNTVNGVTYNVYTYDGQFVISKSFRNSQYIAQDNFIRDYLN